METPDPVNAGLSAAAWSDDLLQGKAVNGEGQRSPAVSRIFPAEVELASTCPTRPALAMVMQPGRDGVIINRAVRLVLDQEKLFVPSETYASTFWS